MPRTLETWNPTTNRVRVANQDVYIGDRNTGTFRPVVELGQFKNKRHPVDLKIEYDTRASGTRETRDNKAIYKAPTFEHHAYALDNNQDVEIELVLTQRPATNVFRWNISNHQSLDFFYQPPLSAEVDELMVTATDTEGFDAAGNVIAQRPENVVGSYAVYHKQHDAQSDANSPNATVGTSKVFHIYRPKVVDADGREIWGVLDYRNGVLSVTVDSNYLATARYPVSIDPTLGYFVTGASWGGSTTANTFLCWFDMPNENAAVPINSCRAWQYNQTSAQNRQWWVYSDHATNAAPNLILDRTVNFSVTTSQGVGTISPGFTTLALLANQRYWLGHHLGNGTSGQTQYYRYDNSTANRTRYKSITYNVSDPGAWGTGSTGQSRIINIEINYNVQTPNVSTFGMGIFF